MLVAHTSKSENNETDGETDGEIHGETDGETDEESEYEYQGTYLVIIKPFSKTWINIQYRRK
jgi:hypothetical protein